MGGDKCQAGESESLLKIDILLRRAQGGTTCWFRCNQQTAERSFKESFEGGNQKNSFYLDQRSYGQREPLVFPQFRGRVCKG
jgi:hypothetical protein